MSRTFNLFLLVKPSSDVLGKTFVDSILRPRCLHTCQRVCVPLKRSTMGQTSLLLQDGTSFQELPMAVRNVHGNDLETLCSDQSKKLPIDGGGLVDVNLNNWESLEMVAGFERCYSPRGVFKLLELIPSDEVTPEVALQALKSLIRLESNNDFRNKTGFVNSEETSETFTRTAVLNNLFKEILKSEKSHVLLDGLRTTVSDGSTIKCNDFRNQLCEEILLRVSEGKFSVGQVCDAIRVFAILDKRALCDKLWVGLTGKDGVIDESNVLDVFRAIPHLVQSRALIFNYAELHLRSLWHKLNGRDIAEILAISSVVRNNSYKILKVVAAWLCTNIHRVSEDDLASIVEGMKNMHFAEDSVQTYLEKFVKVKGLKVLNPALFVSLMEYCLKFRIRSSIIFNCCSEYLLRENYNLTASQLSSLLTPFGQFDFHPDSGAAFWTTVEEVLLRRFVEFHPNDALDVMLACVYLEKYPLNFVNKIFNPYFLDRIHSVQQGSLLSALRAKLKLLDTAMMLECSTYGGPLLPRDRTAKSLWQDGRVKRATNLLMNTLRSSVDGYFSTSVLLRALPLANLYVIDLLLHKKPLDSPVLDAINPNTCVAVLIQLPEHFDSTQQHLIGPQVMRRRHFRHLGLPVVDMEYSVIQKLSVLPGELISSFKEKLAEQTQSHALL